MEPNPNIKQISGTAVVERIREFSGWLRTLLTQPPPYSPNAPVLL